MNRQLDDVDLLLAGARDRVHPSAALMERVLAVSVALNLGVLGMVGGAVLKGGPDGHRPMVRDVSFGFFLLR